MNLVASLEDKAVASSGHLFPEMDSREQFADLFVDRINVLTAKLTRIVGPKRAKAHLTSVAAKLNKEA
ncbi:MAG: hypothetical protein IPH09_16495 [bacterium]|nr:hypothetical protein [bacterium]